MTNERRFDLGLALVLLGFAIWYGITMYNYPVGAGRIPAIVAAIMAGTLILQILLMFRAPSRTLDEADLPDRADGELQRDLSDHPATSSSITAPERTNEPEPDTYDTLIALSGTRRRRFFTIVAFSIAFYVGSMIVGFVVTSGALIGAVLLFARERAYVAVLGAILGSAAAYGLVVGLLNMRALDGYLLG